MAIFHLNTKPIKRSSGRSATASASYRCGVAMTDERTGVKHDYTRKQGVMNTRCFMFDSGGGVIIELDRSELWNKAEISEKRKDGRTAREVIVNIPHELSTEERTKLVDIFALSIADKYSCGVDYAIHLPDKEGDLRNHHAHIMMTTRAIELDYNGKINLTDKTQLEWENKRLKENDLPTTQEQIKSLRSDWSKVTNKALELNNIDDRIDHRSFKEQGKEIIPTVKMGVNATKMERRGIKTDVGDINREIKADRVRMTMLGREISRHKHAIKTKSAQDKIKKEEKEDYEQRIDSARRQLEICVREAEVTKQRISTAAHRIDGARLPVESPERGVMERKRKFDNTGQNNSETQQGIEEAKQRADSTKQRAKRTGQRADSTGQRADSTKHRTGGTKQRVVESKQRVFGTKQRVFGTKQRVVQSNQDTEVVDIAITEATRGIGEVTPRINIIKQQQREQQEQEQQKPRRRRRP